jgi:hypothetical protein
VAFDTGRGGAAGLALRTFAFIRVNRALAGQGDELSA